MWREQEGHSWKNTPLSGLQALLEVLADFSGFARVLSLLEVSLGKRNQSKFSRISANGFLVFPRLPCKSRGAKSLAEQGDVWPLNEQGFNERLGLICKIST